MHHVIGQCPICNEELAVIRLQCSTCGATLDGRFSLGPWYHLSDEQLTFLRSFIRNQGKITWVAEELGQSYPTVRARLNEIIRTLGLAPRAESPDDEHRRTTEQRRAILGDLSTGRISAEEAARLLQNIAD